jgi:lactate permease
VLVFLVDGKRGLRQTWPVALVAGGVFGLAQFVTSNFFAVELTDVVAAVATVGAVLLMLRVWKPKEIVGHSTGDEAGSAGSARTGSAPAAPAAGGSGSAPAVSVPAGSAPAATLVQTVTATERHSGRTILSATAPYLTIIAIFSLAQIPAVKAWLLANGSVVFDWPGLDVVDSEGNAAGSQVFRLDHLRATGSLLFLSGLVTMAIYKIAPREGLKAFGRTVKQLRWTIVTVMAVLALSFVMNLSGQTASMGNALASTGSLFVVLSPALGWLGVALTGSDTSSNSLFGLLQVTAANSAGLNPVLVAAANSSAGVMGKMLSVQNLAVAAAAVGLKDAESTLLRKLIGWSLGLLAFITVLIVLQSTPVLGWMVP